MNEEQLRKLVANMNGRNSIAVDEGLSGVGRSLAENQCDIALLLVELILETRANGGR